MFAREYLIDLNAKQAAIRAGYSPRTAEQQASRLLVNIKVAPLIAAGMRAREARVDVTADRVLRELARVAFADIGEAFAEDGSLLPVKQIPIDTRRALASIDSDELREDGAAVGMVRKVKLADKLRALEMLAKHTRVLEPAPDFDPGLLEPAERQQLQRLLLRAQVRTAAPVGGEATATAPPDDGEGSSS